jgi:hypothetical protein
MTGIFMTGYAPPKEVSRKGAILQHLLNKYRKSTETSDCELGDMLYYPELEAEGLIKPPAGGRGCGPYGLTKKGIEVATSPGGYVGLKYEEFRRFDDGEKSRELDIEIKKKQLEQLEQKTVQALKPCKPLSISELESLLKASESSTLDFKREMYNFDDDKDDKKLAKFIKDIISFSNTVRTETSYIIIGVGINADGSKELVGLDKYMDESLLQAKVKNKVFPLPQFSFYTIEFQGKTFGVFQFPIFKYSRPLAASVKIKGLEVGMFYYRHGSSNEQAIGDMVINISDWLRTLPEQVYIESNNDYSVEMGQLLKRATNKNELLSEIFADALIVGKRYKLNQLIDFCSDELKGITQDDLNNNKGDYKYRLQNVVWSFGKFEPNPFFRGTLRPSDIINTIKAGQKQYEYKMLFTHSLIAIESFIEKSEADKTYSHFQSSAKKMIPEYKGKDVETTIYLFNDNYTSVYKNIRQKLIDVLVLL